LSIEHQRAHRLSVAPFFTGVTAIIQDIVIGRLSEWPITND
jgi:hypothetical protein